MRVSLNWINELINIENIDLKELVEKLTLGGFEVEEILEFLIDEKKEITVDISATANRADSLSVKGIAKEISSLTNKPLIQSLYLIDIGDTEFKNKIQHLSSTKVNLEDCPVFFAVTLENLTTVNSPKWLKQRLISVGLTPVNSLIDFQNYVLLETGYPFEFYDFEKIKQRLDQNELSLTLGVANSNDKFIANNNIEYSLNEDTSVLKADNQILSIAGIISNNDFAYTTKTTSLLIEGAIFNSKKIRQASRTLGLRTDRSARFEKGLNSTYLSESFYRLIFLLKTLNPNLSCKLVTVHQNNNKELLTIDLGYKNIIEILGPVINDELNSTNQIAQLQISDYLRRLDFEFSYNTQKLEWKVIIPSSRCEDITREIDLIEEIGRLHGFDNFLTCLPKIHQLGNEDSCYQIKKKITFCFLSEGLNEFVHYSLVNTEKNNTIELINPLISDCSQLRISLLPNLVKTISDNIKQGNSNIEGFEFGHIFSVDLFSDYKEIEYVAGIFGGVEVRKTWSDVPSFLSWFEAKGKIEEIFSKLNLQIYWKVLELEIYQNILHPYRSTELYLSDGKCVGVFGQIHPILAKTLEIPSQLYLFEFDFELLKINLQNNRLPFYKHYSLYPKVTKDLSFIVDNTISFERIKTVILNSKTKFLTHVELLDEYRGESIPSSSISLCIQLVFQSDQETLITLEIEEMVQNIQMLLSKEFNIKVRI